MTPELRNKLDAIKAECRLMIELGDRAVKGPWSKGHRQGGGFFHLAIVPADGEEWVCSVSPLDFVNPKDAANTDFIAHSRTFSPAAGQLAITLIEATE